MEKRRLLLGSLIILVLFIPNLIWGYACTAKATGNFNAASTWDNCNSTYPQPTVDTWDISGYTVTVTADITVGNGTVANASDGTLIIGTGSGSVTFTTGTLTFGNGTSKNATVTLAGGGKLSHGSNAVTLNNFTLNSTSTSDSWAFITGSGAWATGAVSGPKQAINLSYVSVQTTGNMTFTMANTTGTMTSGFIASHCVFYGTGLIYIGSSSTPVTAHRKFEYCDFVDCVGSSNYVTTFHGEGYHAAVTGDFWFKHCTFRNSLGVIKYFPIFAQAWYGGMVVEDCVLSEYSILLNTGSLTHMKRNLISKTISTPESIINLLPGGATDNTFTFDSNYIIPRYNNPIGITGLWPSTSYTHTISNNVFEAPSGSGMTAIFSATGFTGTFAITNNVSMHPGQLFVPGGLATGSVTLQNNSQLYNETGGEKYNLWLTHGTGRQVTGTVNHRNNLHDYYGTHYEGAITSVEGVQCTLADDDVDKTQVLTNAGYNGHNNMTTKYKDVVITNDYSAYDINASAKYKGISYLGGFSANTTAMSKWNSKFGSGTQSDADAVTFHLGQNGYDSGTKTQIAANAFSSKVAKMVEWVRYNVSPTNGQFRKAGYDGTTIGAMEWQNPRRARAQ